MRFWRSIRARLFVVAAMPVVGLLVVAAFGGTAFNEVRVEGPNYDRIITSRDVLADVAPPREYIIESYLTVLQLASGPPPEVRPMLISQLDRLERQFEDRHAHWDRHLTNPQIRQALLVDAYQPAAKFFRAVEEKFLPAVERGDLVAARMVADRVLFILYDEHRSAIDRVVDLSGAEQRAIEAETDALISDRVRLLAMLLAMFLLCTLLGGAAVVRSIVRPIARLQRVAVEELPRTIEYVRSADLDAGLPQVAPIELGTRDELADAAEAFNAVVAAAIDLAAGQARLRRNMTDAFVSFGRRNQNLVARQLRFIDQLERAETDPQQAANLFRLDHLATRIRRNAESLLVLAGVDPPRKWRQPVPLVDVVRSALGEVEEYSAVRLGSIAPGAVSGLAVADLSHLLAELIENAIRFSPPESPVMVNGGYLDGRYHLAVIDQGMGLAPRDLQLVNDRLGHVSKDEGTPTGNLGLFVVARLAARHGIRVQLESEGGVGTTAWVTLPATLFEVGDERGVRWSRSEPPSAVIQRRHPVIVDGRERRQHSQAIPRATGERPMAQGQHVTIPQARPSSTTQGQLSGAAHGQHGSAASGQHGSAAQGQQSGPPQGWPGGTPQGQQSGVSQGQQGGLPQRARGGLPQDTRGALPAPYGGGAENNAPPAPLPIRTPSAGAFDVTSSLTTAGEDPSHRGAPRSLPPADDSTYTAAGFPKRQPKPFAPGATTEMSPTLTQPPPSQNQPPVDIRDRYRQFAAGKRHAQNNPPPGDQRWT